MDKYLAALTARQEQLQNQSIRSTHDHNLTKANSETNNMGLIRDSIGQALGAGQVQTGFNGPRIPFSNRTNSGRFTTPQPPRRPPPGPDYQAWSNDCGLPDSLTSNFDYAGLPSASSANYGKQASPNDCSSPRYGNTKAGFGSSRYTDGPPAYGTQLQPPCAFGSNSARVNGYQDQYQGQMASSPFGASYDYQDQSYNDNSRMRSSGSMRSSGFRPLALPQVEYGDGKPFLRGYGDELRRYGIEERDFINILDTVNKAVIPNPENQIFQKAANIAGWFV